MTEPLLLTVKQAAAAVPCGRDRMYELVKTGAVRHVSLGRRILIPPAALTEWIERELEREAS